MKKVQLCSGDVYLKGYENCDIDGYVIDHETKNAIKSFPVLLNAEDLSIQCDTECVSLSNGNPNETTLEKYFIRPFNEDSKKRTPKVIIIDTKMNILEPWPWEDQSVDELVMVNSFEHFWHTTEIPFIIEEAKRVLKVGGVFKFDFPDVLEIIRRYNRSNPRFMMELIYGSRKNKHSCHEWGYTQETIRDFFRESDWELKFRNVVTHDYPSTGVFVTKK